MNTRSLACLLALCLGLSVAVAADPVEIQTTYHRYSAGDVACFGVLSQPAVQVKMLHAYPAILVLPEWWGISDHTRQVAGELAAQGYVVLVADLYGNGQYTDDPRQAGAWATPLYQDRDLMAARAGAALATLAELPQVDATRVGAIGFCFGGSVALELVRRAAPLRAAVAVHAGLESPTPFRDGDLAPVLVLHGGADPLVPPAQVTAFAEQALAAGLDWQFVSFPRALHAFTNPAADRLRETLPVAYDAAADARSRILWNGFFAARLTRN